MVLDVIVIIMIVQFATLLRVGQRLGQTRGVPNGGVRGVPTPHDVLSVGKL